MTKDTTVRHHPVSGERIPIDPTRPVEVIVQNVLGDIEVKAVPGTDGRFHCERSRWNDLAAEINVQVEDNRIVVQTGFNRTFDLGELARGIFGRGRDEAADQTGDWGNDVAAWAEETGRSRRSGHGGRADMLVELPIGVITHAKLRTAAGDVKLSGIAGTIDVAVASGDIEARHAAGEISAKSASGDILIEGARGTFKLHSASGDVVLRKADIDRYLVRTASGDILLEESRLTAIGPFKVDTVSGDVSLRHTLSPTAGARGVQLDFKTVSGDASVKPPLTAVGKRRWQLGSPGDDALSIAVRSVSGDLDVRLTPDATQSPAPPNLALPSIADEAPRDDDQAATANQPEAPAIPSVPPEPPVPPVPPVPPGPDATPSFGADYSAARRELERAAEEVERSARDAARHADQAAMDAEQAAAEAARAAADTALIEGSWIYDHQPPTTPASAPYAEPARDEAADPEREAERLAVLAAVERGEIDVDEALRRLESDGEEQPAADSAGAERP